jgi:formylglycine-generating enzyme required for sulfatase activity
MATWDREIDLGARAWALSAALLAGAVIAWVTLLGVRSRGHPAHCREGFVSLSGRCCAPGQGISNAACVGIPEACPAPYELVETPTAGCVLAQKKILITGGGLTLGPTDWDSASLTRKYTITVANFWMDRAEVSHHQYQRCVQVNLCRSVAESKEPGTPLTGVTVEDAKDYCAFSGGRLPTPQEWTYAAAGSEARRYPWGPHGLVCRRAVYGLWDGPCAQGVSSPEISGMRPDGATPQGVMDLAGNVSELCLSETQEPSYHGGSFRTQSAGQLKTWAEGRLPNPEERGFRCVYDLSNPR